MPRAVDSARTPCGRSFRSSGRFTRSPRSCWSHEVSAMIASDKPDPGSCRTDETETPEQNSPPSWLPDDATIVSEETFTSPKGRRSRILRTNQTDAYDDPPEGEPTSTTPRSLLTSSWKPRDGGRLTADKGR